MLILEDFPSPSMPQSATVSSISVNFTRLAFATVSVNSYVELQGNVRTYRGNAQDTWTVTPGVSQITLSINPPMSFGEMAVLGT